MNKSNFYTFITAFSPCATDWLDILNNFIHASHAPLIQLRACLAGSTNEMLRHILFSNAIGSRHCQSFMTLNSRVSKVWTSFAYKIHYTLLCVKTFPQHCSENNLFFFLSYTRNYCQFITEMEMNCYYNVRQCVFNHKRKHLWKPSVIDICETEPMEDFVKSKAILKRSRVVSQALPKLTAVMSRLAWFWPLAVPECLTPAPRADP